MVGTSKKLTVRDEYSEIVIEGEIVERYTGIVSSFREIAINDLGLLKSVKTKYSVDYYLIKLSTGDTKHILCSDVLKIEAIVP